MFQVRVAGLRGAVAAPGEDQDYRVASTEAVHVVDIVCDVFKEGLCSCQQRYAGTAQRDWRAEAEQQSEM